DDDQRLRLAADARGAATRHSAAGLVREAERRHQPAPLRAGQEGRSQMKPNAVAVVGAAETTKMGVIPDLSVSGLHADAALNAMADCGLKPSDIDGLATAGVSP